MSPNIGPRGGLPPLNAADENFGSPSSRFLHFLCAAGKNFENLDD